MIAYHVVTVRPMYVGQKIVFDEENRSGVNRRVYDRMPLVEEIYQNPDKYDDEALEHYAALARSLGGRITCWYQDAYAVCNHGKVYTFMDDCPVNDF